MRRFSVSLFLILSSSAFAADYTGCMSPLCGGLHAAMLDSLADEGLTDVDGVQFSTDAAGGGWLTILSTDPSGLDLIAPGSGARTVPIPGTVSFARTVPMALGGVDVITVPGLGGAIAIPNLVEARKSGGGSGGGGDCYWSCACTEDGEECWLEYP